MSVGAAVSMTKRNLFFVRAEQTVHAEDDLVRPVWEPPGREDDLVALVLRLDRLAVETPVRVDVAGGE